MNDRNLQTILEITRRLAATTELDDLLGLVIDAALDLLDAERASILLYDEVTHELVSRVAVGEHEIRFPADRGIAGETIRSGATLNVPDAYADGRFNQDIDKQTGFRTRSILSVPLTGFDGRLVGVLQVLNKRSEVFSADDETLAETFAAQAGVSLQRARLMVHYREKLQMERAMEIAREIQQGLLPKVNPTIPDFELAGISEPADHTGGDTFDFIPLPDGEWLLVVADASGHGIGPALVVAETRAMLRASSFDGCQLTRMLETVNDLLARDLVGRFVTCFVGILDPTTHTITYASAGHGPMVFYNYEEDRFDRIIATGIPLGLMEGADYTETISHTFAPGDFLAITTDGYFEASCPEGDMYGVERMIDFMRDHRELPAEQLLARLDHEICTFIGDQDAQDDRTGILLRRMRS
jgi:sigma-B regulation protein RsbU (phosphoserine phosphatase)